MKPTQQNRTGKATKQDVVMTPFPTAKYIVDYFKPTGKMLEPCKGHGAFLRAMQEYNFATKGMSVEDDDVDWNKAKDPTQIDGVEWDKTIDID